MAVIHEVDRVEAVDFIEIELEQLMPEEKLEKYTSIDPVNYSLQNIIFLDELKNSPQLWMRHYHPYIDDDDVKKAIKILKDNRHIPGVLELYNSKYKPALDMYRILCEIYRLCIAVVEKEIDLDALNEKITELD